MTSWARWASSYRAYSAPSVVVLLAALVVALLLQRLVARFLASLGLDDLFRRTGAADSLWRLGYGDGPSRLISTVLFWGVLLTGVAGALSVLGLSSLQTTTEEIVNLSGRAPVAFVILMAGTMSAGWLAELVAREAGRAELRGANAFRRIVLATVAVIAALLAAALLGLKTYVLIILAVIVLSSIDLVPAFAFGQGLALLSGNIAAGRYVQDGTALGDVISVDGIDGTVEELGYASVTLRSENGYLYRIPNRTLLEKIARKRPT